MKKFIDNKGKLFGVVSIVDILVVLVVIVLGIGVYVRFFVNEETAIVQPQEEITFSINLKSLRSFSAESFEVGDKVYDENGTYLGKITDVKIVDATGSSQLIDGTTVEAPIIDKYDVTLTINGEGTIRGGVHYVNRTVALKVNMSKKIQTKYVVVTGNISAVSAGA